MISNEGFSTQALASRCYYLSEMSFEFGSPWNEKQFFDHLNEPNVWYLFEEDGGEINAFMSISFVLDEAEIVMIAVNPALKGNGLGLKLMNRGIKKLRDKKSHHLFLEVRSSNQVAISFYKKIGFNIIGERKKYYHHPKEDAILMELII